MIIDVSKNEFIGIDEFTDVFYEFDMSVKDILDSEYFISESISEKVKDIASRLIQKVKNLFDWFANKIKEISMKFLTKYREHLTSKDKAFSLTNDGIKKIILDHLDSSTYYDYYVPGRDGENMLVFAQKIVGTDKLLKENISQQDFLKMLAVDKEEFKKNDLQGCIELCRKFDGSSNLTSKYVSDAKTGRDAAIKTLNDVLGKMDKNDDTSMQYNRTAIQNMMNLYSASLSARLKDFLFNVKILRTIASQAPKKLKDLNIKPDEEGLHDSLSLRDISIWFKNNNLGDNGTIGAIIYPKDLPNNNQSKRIIDYLKLSRYSDSIAAVIFDKDSNIIKYKKYSFSKISSKMQDKLAENEGWISVER